MAVSKVFHGARGQVFVNGQISGIFSSISYGVDIDVSPAFVLGRFSPMELDVLAQEAISLTCTGWRVLNEGPYSGSIGVPKLQDLLTVDDITISLYDRQTGNFIMTVVGCKSQGWSSGLDSKAQQTLTVRFLGLRLEDEEGDQGEAASATQTF